MTELRRAIFAAYRSKTPGSEALYGRACRTLAGGTTGNLRYYAPYPIYETGGRGSIVVDVDGNEYIDCFLCNGPLLLGHNHPSVTNAISEHEETGPLVVNPPVMIDAAELIAQTVPSAERVRFLNSGTEAVITAVRYARAYTGKNKIIKFYGHYHGQYDQVLTGMDATDAKLGAGIPDEVTAHTVLARYGDIDALSELVESRDGIAAIILDPAMHAGGLWGSNEAFLKSVRALTEKHHIVLIFDEVITGYRLALGGGQAHYDVTPDLTTLGKALAAGGKLAAVAGKEDIMRVVDPMAPADFPKVFQSGTGNDGTAALAAAVGAITTYQQMHEKGRYQDLFRLSEKLAHGISQAFSSRGLACHVNQLGPMLQLFLSSESPSFERYADLDMELLSLFFLALINEGVLLTLPTSNHIYLSFSHTDADIEFIIEKSNLVLDKYDFSSTN